MKKSILCLSILIGSLTASAQFVQPQPNPIDLKLEKFRKQHTFGTGMQIVGAAICALGYYTQRTNGNLYQPYYIMGSGIMLGGTITRIASYRHLKNTQVAEY